MATTNYTQIKYEVKNYIAIITLSRPKQMNAWTDMMEKEVRHAFRTAGQDIDNVRVIIITGAGRAFCAGADMNVLQSIHSSSSRQTPRSNLNRENTSTSVDPLSPPPYHPDAVTQPNFRSPRLSFPVSVPQPVICAINGPVAGMAFVLTLFCDIRFIASDAIMTTSFAQRGLIAEHGIGHLLPLTVGISRAADLLYSSRKVNASEAVAMGLVSAQFPQAQFMEKVMEYATNMATNVSPRSLRVIKYQIWSTLLPTDDALVKSIAQADKLMADSFTSGDFKEGVAHFVEKRKPVWPKSKL